MFWLTVKSLCFAVLVTVQTIMDDVVTAALVLLLQYQPMY